MRELLIDIDDSSCESFGFLSDEFSSALEDEFGESPYTLKIVFSTPLVEGVYPSGFSRFELANPGETEVDEIDKRIKNIFRALSSSVKKKI